VFYHTAITTYNDITIHFPVIVNNTQYINYNIRVIPSPYSTKCTGYKNSSQIKNDPKVVLHHNCGLPNLFYPSDQKTSSRSYHSMGKEHAVFSIPMEYHDHDSTIKFTLSYIHSHWHSIEAPISDKIESLF